MADELGHYKILDRIGGSAVEVFRARDMSAGRTVTLKVFPSDIEPSVRRRLLERAERVATLSHPVIATLYEIGDEGGLYLACEFVPGLTLSTLLGDGPLNPRRAVDLATQIADALADGHAHDVVHGELTADAVMVTPKGQAKVLDFGLTEWTMHFGDGAPQQAPAPSSDISALGRLLFQMLIGRTTTDGGPLTPSAVNRSVPRELDPIVMKAIGRSGGGPRYEAAAVLAADLRQAARRLDERAAQAAVEMSIAPQQGGRNPGIWIVCAVVVVALAAAAWWMF